MFASRIKAVLIGFAIFNVAVFMGACSQTKQYTLWGNTSSENGVYKIGNPYQVMGTWYYPEENYYYEEVGVASWYGPDFHNGVTANGEIYDMNLMTAAHRTLPLPSIVKVTNLENGRSVILRVNDRGPFANDRIIDVSRLAAERLGFHVQGTTRVKVEILANESRELKKAMLAGDMNTRTTYIDDEQVANEEKVVRSVYDLQKTVESVDDSRGTTIRSLTTVPVEMIDERTSSLLEKNVNAKGINEVANASGTGFYVQVGAFANRDNAQKFMSNVAKYGDAQISTAKINGKNMYRVRIGAFTSGQDALKMLDKVRSLGYKDARIVEELELTKRQ